MAGFSPNEAQLSAIRQEGSNILVSAGAGSGKTTVLVERIIRMIIEERADIDSFIVVTFTRAAAAHMKEKIYSRIKAALKEDDLSEELREHLKCQLMRVFSARISTIDSLCMEIVREHFQYVDIDPSFRIADEAEISLLKQDVLEKLIEQHYAEPTEGFLNFVDYYTDKNDARLEDIILTMYNFSQSHPEPERWIRTAVGPYLHARKMGSDVDPAENLWIQELGKLLNQMEESLLKKAEAGLALCDLPDGPSKYRENFDTVLSALKGLSGMPFDKKGFLIRSLLESWPRLKAIRKTDDVNDDLKERTQELYKNIKAGLQTLSEDYYYQDLEQMYHDMADCGQVALTIAKLTLEYSRMLMEEKKARLIADFNDVAHFALQVLIRRDTNGDLVFTEAADSIARATREIIVDEYQDTNRMQDALIMALSAERFGRPNVFMVGDVKQSIYGFRMACPDLFIEKFNAYTDPEGNGQRIILGENYRSRKEIIDYINFVFDKIMIPDVGGVDYQDGNFMLAGASYPELPDECDPSVELIYINAGGEDGKNAESYEVARKIEEIVASHHVTDDDGTLRKANYSDIAILTRKTNNPKLEKMLTDRHIPVRKSSSKGFFASFEIRLALNLLRIIDNPLQDIPFAAVLLSPMTGLDANALAEIRSSYRSEPFFLYNACRFYAEQNTNRTAGVLADFLEMIEVYREKARDMGIRALLEELLTVSGLRNMCAAMTYGETRAANLSFLISLAEKFSSGSYTGLFNFIRYIEAMQKADMDFGSADVSGGGEDAVTMMTIHKSKGLEFPIVIVADCARQIRDQDVSAPIFLDDTLGVGLERRDLTTRIKRRTLMMKTIEAVKKNRLFSEEIRLLYVAMSRAKEKLVLTGAAGRMESHIREWEQAGAVLPDSASLMKANSYLFLLGEAMKCAEKEDKESFRWMIKDLEDVETERVYELFDEAVLREKVESIVSSAEKTPEDLSELADSAGIYAYDYPYLSATRTNVKVTASQMEKHETERDGGEETAFRFRKKQEGALTGAERGNAYHKLFELIDYEALDKLLDSNDVPGGALPDDPEEKSDAEKAQLTEDELITGFVKDQLAALNASGHLSDAAVSCIVPEKITAFLRSSIGKRMRHASVRGTLRREQQFVMTAVIDGNPDGIMQGIIDAFFVEESEGQKYVVLVDYKTDRNRPDSYFAETYRGQQEEYARACEAALNLPVKEKILYAVDPEKEIYL